MIFMIIPKINIINVTKNVFEVFKENNRTRITLHNKFQVLNPYSEASQKISKGDVTYFQFEILEA